MHRRKRWARGKALAAVMLALVACVECTAQTLDLDAGASFKGSERSVERLTKSLRDTAKESGARAAKLDGGPALLLRSQIRAGEFAAAVLEAGAALGDAGSVHILLGRRIASRATELDKALGDVLSIPGGVGERRLEAFLKDCPSDPKAIPRSVDELDALTSRVFGELSRAAGRPVPEPWPIVRLDPALGSDEALRRAIAECAKAPGVTRQTIDALTAFGDSLIAAEKSGVPAARLAAERQLLVQGAAIVLRTPKWMTPKAAAAQSAAFEGAARRMEVEGTRNAARADLCRLALLADTLARIDAARLTSRQTKSIRTAALALAEGVSSGDGACDDALGAMRRGLVLLDAYDTARWSENRRVVREVRVFWREAQTRGRRARDELIEMLARLTPSTPALSDPAMLGAMSALRERLDDGRRLCVLSAWLAGDPKPGLTGPLIWNGTAPKSAAVGAGGDAKVREPVTQKEDRTRRQAALKLLALGQKLTDEKSRDDVMNEVRAFADALAAWMPMAGEDDLRAAAASPQSPIGVRWRDLTGGATAAILKAVDDARDAHLTAWAGVKEPPAKGASPMTAEPDLGRIDVLRQLVEMTVHAGAAADLNAAPGWPGFELSASATSLILAASKADLNRAGGFVISGEDPALAKCVKDMKEHANLVAALAGMQRAGRSHALAQAGVLAELAYPPPVLPTLGEDLTPGVWLARERDSIALLCRCLEEYADAGKDRARAAAMLKQALAEADRLQAIFN